MLNQKPLTHDCRFCNLPTSRLTQASADRILAESDGYFALTSIGAFIPGWTLIFPKRHRLNLSSDYPSQELIDFAAYVEEMVTNEYGKCIVFEHGSNAEGSATSCGVNHAHLHIVPFVGDIESLAQEEDSELAWQVAAIGQLARMSNQQEYLFCANSLEKAKHSGLLTTLKQPQSQFFRRVLANAVGLSEFYDYKRYRFEDIANDSADRLRNKFLASMAA